MAIVLVGRQELLLRALVSLSVQQLQRGLDNLAMEQLRIRTDYLAANELEPDSMFAKSPVQLLDSACGELFRISSMEIVPPPGDPVYGDERQLYHVERALSVSLLEEVVHEFIEVLAGIATLLPGKNKYAPFTSESRHEALVRVLYAQVVIPVVWTAKRVQPNMHHLCAKRVRQHVIN